MLSDDTDDAMVDACIERICAHGCRAVHAIILNLEHGDVIDETRDLSAAQRAKVLLALKTIMAVYETTDSCQFSP